MGQRVSVPCPMSVYKCYLPVILYVYAIIKILFLTSYQNFVIC